MTFQILTNRTNKRNVSPIDGKNPSWGRRNSLFLTVSRHVSCGYFYARIPGVSSRLWREGGEYNTLRGNKPACLRTGFEPPATSAVVESLIGGVVQRYPEGDIMTAQSHPESIRVIPCQTNNCQPRYNKGESLWCVDDAERGRYSLVIDAHGRQWIGKRNEPAPIKGRRMGIVGAWYE